jgi:hypothetical protein
MDGPLHWRPSLYHVPHTLGFQRPRWWCFCRSFLYGRRGRRLHTAGEPSARCSGGPPAPPRYSGPERSGARGIRAWMRGQSRWSNRRSIPQEKSLGRITTSGRNGPSLSPPIGHLSGMRPCWRFARGAAALQWPCRGCSVWRPTSDDASVRDRARQAQSHLAL